MTNSTTGLYAGFEGYRTPSEADYVDVIRTGIVVLDTNVLLDLYRYTDQARTELLNVLGKLGDRLWIPNHVLHEFWRNRESALWDPVQRASDTTDLLRKNLDSSRSGLRSWANRVSLDERRQRDMESGLDALYQALIESVESFVDEDAIRQAKSTGQDPLLTALEPVLLNRVGPAMHDEAYIQAVKEAERRNKLRLPPGYMDRDKGEEHLAAGDYIVWEQILTEAAKRKMDLLLVTGDAKEDWWHKVRGETRGPRVELVKEMKTRSGKRLYMVRTKSLLYFARKALKVSVGEETLRNVELIDSSRASSVTNAWSPATARALISRLVADAPVQARVVLFAAEHDGFVSREDVYRLGSYEDSRMLRGFTRPANRIGQLVLDPEGLREEPVEVLKAVYNSDISYVQASGFRIPDDLVNALGGSQESSLDELDNV